MDGVATDEKVKQRRRGRPEAPGSPTETQTLVYQCPVSRDRTSPLRRLTSSII